MPLVNALPPPEDGPQVGIFWGLPRSSSIWRLVIDVTPLGKGERYGEFMTHPRGHHDVWEAWRSLGPAGLAKLGLPATIVWHEYEHFPRGRIVFHEPTGRFVIYADRKLQGKATVDNILEAFHLSPEACTVQSDLHYQSHRDSENPSTT